MNKNTTTGDVAASLQKQVAEKETSEHQSTSAVDTAPSASASPSLANPSEASDSAKPQKAQGYKKRRKLYQGLAKVEASLKVIDDELVLVTKGDKAEFSVSQIGGPYTAIRLLKRAANRRQGFYSLYLEQEAVRINNFNIEEKTDHPDVPPVDQMFVSGKLESLEDGAFFVDIGRNKLTKKAKQQIRMPLKVEGVEANPEWKLGQWLGLILHREGTNWVWRGDTKAVLKSGVSKKKDKKDQDAEPAQNA